jgi:TrmH family RNA methyltransferase
MYSCRKKLNKEKKIRLVLDGIQDPGNMGTIIRLQTGSD